MQIYKIDSGCYPFKLLFLCNSSTEEAKKWLKEKYPSLDSENLCVRGACCFFMDSLDDYRTYHIWVRDFRPTHIEPVRILTHEIYHLVRDVCNQLNLENTENTEAGAYLFDHVFIQIMNKTLKREKRGKRK